MGQKIFASVKSSEKEKEFFLLWQNIVHILNGNLSNSGTKYKPILWGNHSSQIAKVVVIVIEVFSFLMNGDFRILNSC